MVMFLEILKMLLSMMVAYSKQAIFLPGLTSLASVW